MTFYDFFQDERMSERNGYEINQISRMVENAERRYQKVSDSAVCTFISCLI
jgi:hypothetical protein